MRTILSAIAIVASLALMACPVLKRSEKPFWPFVSLGCVGLFGLAWGIFGVLLTACRNEFAARSLQYFDHYRTLCGGIAVGMFIILIISGNLKPNTEKQEEED